MLGSLIRKDGLEGAVFGGELTHVVHPHGSSMTGCSLVARQPFEDVIAVHHMPRLMFAR